MKKVFKFFDKLEDVTRDLLSHHPLPYAFVGGTLVVLYWRGVWHTADLIEMSGTHWAVFFSAPLQIFITGGLLMLTGLAVSVFIGDSIIISGIKHEKKVFEKAESEIQTEEKEITSVEKRLKVLEDKIDILVSASKGGKK
jgi:hypothetical protein